MMAIPKRKFASQMDEVLLQQLKAIAEADGRLLQAVLEDAAKLYVEIRQSQTPKESVMAHLQVTYEKNRRLIELLAQ